MSIIKVLQIQIFFLSLLPTFKIYFNHFWDPWFFPIRWGIYYFIIYFWVFIKKAIYKAFNSVSVHSSLDKYRRSLTLCQINTRNRMRYQKINTWILHVNRLCELCTAVFRYTAIIFVSLNRSTNTSKSTTFYQKLIYFIHDNYLIYHLNISVQEIFCTD